ncbi:PD-(D/E)XK nuclease family protein [Gramella sp. AN32]|uniref:PD-(D/E)XK nuclease family protein n=1 Tax=Christiangramia antarctica TaxID=2058158 RepID=A0ABW5WZ69_9FLAO|nr:PD-(D/E)XK nuclease family protein [Gramella sp. AN32]
MKSFISEVLEKLNTPSVNFSELIFILPSKRAGSFLLKELAKISDQNIFTPTIFSIEEFTEEISGLEAIDNTITQFEFYNVYKELTPPEEVEDFDTFINWSQSLIHDFNEIDRYLIDYQPFFDYLAAIQDQKHWFLSEDKTDLIKNYLNFWHKLPGYYEALAKKLQEKNLGYQGLIYRQAAENISAYSAGANSKHIFIGFNALNASEQKIIQQLLEDEKAEVFWDIDENFYQDKNHAASLFLRDYLKKWEYYKKDPFQEFSNHFSEEKNIELIGVPKNIGQAKYLGEILNNLDPEEFKSTAVILGEEELLLPTLNSLPATIKELNITMGFPVRNAPINSLFEQLFQLRLNGAQNFYFKEVIAVIKHPALYPLLSTSVDHFIERIHNENLVYIERATILEAFENSDLIKYCFPEKNPKVFQLLEDLQAIIHEIKIHLKAENDKLGLEFLYHFHMLFNKLENLNSRYEHIKTIKSLHNFYRELVGTQTLDFQGQPFEGLQLMGMLESRVLDFETVIITSLNEGVLPAGKSDASFIPYDLKTNNQLPTFREKDAVYTYHFYRILQRAKKVYLLYNTEADGLNSGEKSRFITQLEIENIPNHHLVKKFISPKTKVNLPQLRSIAKTPEIIEKLKVLALSGFSPSALTTYIRNPLDFYYQYIIGVRDKEEVEETIAFNTLGTVVHNCLEDLYKPLCGRFLSEDLIEKFLKNSDDKISAEFEKTYSKAPIQNGKNLLILEVAKRYLHNFLQFELKRIKAGQAIKIIHIEEDLRMAISVNELAFPVFIRGKVDRVEECNGISTIIDYKTGKVENKQLAIADWNEITKDYDNYAKCFQVLTYAGLIAENKDLNFPIEAGIISFKNMRSGILKFAEGKGKDKNHSISENTLSEFGQQLKSLIYEICDPNVPFMEKEIKKNYGSY